MKYFEKTAAKSESFKKFIELIRKGPSIEKKKKVTKKIADFILKFSPRHIRYSPRFK